MPNLLYIENRKYSGIQLGSNSCYMAETEFYHGTGGIITETYTGHACYYADLEPNTTYTIIGLSENEGLTLITAEADLKVMGGLYSGEDKMGFVRRATDQTPDLFDVAHYVEPQTEYTFTTNDSHIHLVVEYTKNSNWDNKVQLNEGSSAQGYSTPTKRFHPLWTWKDGVLTPPIFTEMPVCDEIGAFANAINLKKAIIPPSVKKIGRFSFANTQLTEVTISKKCTYYDTSFPKNCKISFYTNEEPDNVIKIANGDVLKTANGDIVCFKAR